MKEKCDAHHDGHDCSTPGACTKALLAMLERSKEREHRALVSGRNPGDE